MEMTRPLGRNAFNHYSNPGVGVGGGAWLTLFRLFGYNPVGMGFNKILIKFGLFTLVATYFRSPETPLGGNLSLHSCARVLTQ